MKKLSSTMLAALAFFACNMEGGTHTTKAPQQHTTDALNARGLLFLDSFGDLVPTDEALTLIGLEPRNYVASEPITAGQISDDEWAKISPAFYSQIIEAEQEAKEQSESESVEAQITEVHDFCIRIILMSGHAFNAVVTATDKADAYEKAAKQTSQPIARFAVMWEAEAPITGEHHA
jgi:hypothetical protein